MLIEKSDDAHQVWVFRKPSEKWKTECMALKKKGNARVLVLPVVQRVNDTIY